MARLKSATDDLHRMAESRPLQKSLVKGTVPRELYATFLGQIYLVHRFLEQRIDEAGDQHPAFAAVVRPYHRREPQLRDDLEFHGVVPDEIEPTPVTARTLDWIEHERPVALLGILYVLEGSTNGARFIARSLSRAWGPGGLSYQDPHGELQKPRWMQFKQDMNGVGFTADEESVLLEAARATFVAVADISDELCEPATVEG